VRPEELRLLAVAPDGGGLASLPWPALAFTLRKEPIVLLSDAELDQLLADVKAAQGFTAARAEERLAKAYPAERRREEVARALEPAATNWDFLVRQNAARALAVWATAESVPTLIKMLDDQLPHCRAEAMTALAALKDERGAAAVAKRLTDHADRANARKALEAMGPVAEKPVADLLTHADYLVRREACDILKTIGTPASTAGLQAVADEDKSPPVKRAAQEALKAIAARP
jgi:HEAT repeat protein